MAAKSIHRVQDSFSAYVAIGSKLLACLSLLGLIASGGMWLYFWRASSHYVTELADAEIVEDQTKSKVAKLDSVISQAEREHKNAIEKRLSILGVASSKHEQISSRIRSSITDLQGQLTDLVRKKTQAVSNEETAKEKLRLTTLRAAELRNSISADKIAQKAKDELKDLELAISRTEDSLSKNRIEAISAKQSHDLEFVNFKKRLESNSFSEIQQAEKDFQKYRDRLKAAEKNVKSSEDELKDLKEKRSKAETLASPQGSQDAVRLAWQSIDESNETQISLAKAKVSESQSSIKFLESEIADTQRRTKDLNEELILARRAEALEKKEAETVLLESQTTLTNARREEKLAKDELEKAHEATQTALRASVNASRSASFSWVSTIVCGLLLFVSGIFALFAHITTGAGASVEARQTSAKADLLSAKAELLEAEGLVVRHKSEGAARVLEAKALSQKRVAEAKAIIGQASVAKAQAKVIRAKQNDTPDLDNNV